MSEKRAPETAEVDPQEIYLHGFCFQWASERLRDVKQIPQSELAFVAQPSMVLSAFASELYLKCLIGIETGRVPDRTHNLKELFGLIDPQRQSQIEAMWDLEMQDPSKVKVRALIKEAAGVTVPTDLAWTLGVGAQGFVEMRYNYEPKNAEAKFLLGDFPRLVKAVILQLKPEWQSLRPKAVIM